MKNLIDTIIQKATWKKAILLSIPYICLQIILLMSVANLLNITNGANILDFEFGFTYNEALKILTNLNLSGREYYHYRIIPIDFFFPFSYMHYCNVKKFPSITKNGLYINPVLAVC